MSRSTAYLWAGGATLMLVTLVVARDDRAYEPALLVTAGFAYVVSLFAFAIRLLPARAIEPLIALATVTICTAIALGGASVSMYDLFLVWVPLWTFSFLPWRRAAPQLVLMVVAYVVALLVSGPPGDVVGARSAMLIGTLFATAAFVGLLKARVDRLMLELSDAARHDSVTGLLNRRGFEEAYESELDRARRSGRPLSLLVADLDHLKEINDRLGHQAGDTALEQVGAALTDVARRIDSVARTGGDEFAVLLPDTDAPGALVMAERLCAAVRTTGTEWRMPLTLSVGGATYAGGRDGDEELVRRADEAAYAAKRLGRDRAVLFSSRDPVRA